MNGLLLKYKIDRNRKFTHRNRVHESGQTVSRQLGGTGKALPRTHDPEAPGRI